MDAREKAAAEATQGDALAGIAWALDLAGDWLEASKGDHDPEDMDALARDLAAARDMLERAAQVARKEAQA